MPAYNEQGTIELAIADILRINFPYNIELIVVDDGSTDSTWKLLSRLRDERVTVHRHFRNRGKGAALLSALTLATGTHAIPFDADLEYMAEDILRVCEPVFQGRCNIVYGARLFGFNTVYQSYRYAVGNRMLTRVANVLFDSYLSDLHTCLKLVPVPTLRSLPLKEQRFGLDTEITAFLLKNGIRPFEVPVSYYSRSRAQGKKITWRDGVSSARILLGVRIWRRSPKIAVAESVVGANRRPGPTLIHSEISERRVPRWRVSKSVSNGYNGHSSIQTGIVSDNHSLPD